MQCFQKDPNLRVSARKLLRHPWIVGCRRSEAPTARAPSNFNQAVEEVKQWNKALKSSETSLRASMGSDGGLTNHIVQVPNSKVAHVEFHRPNFAYSSRSSGLGKTTKQPSVGSFSSLEMGGKAAFNLAGVFKEAGMANPRLDDDDNWENDFETAISPTALKLPQIKPQDNFGGLLSSDRLKAFAESHRGGNSSGAWEDNSQDDLLTIKPRRKVSDDADPFAQIVRPVSETNQLKAGEMRTQLAASRKGSHHPGASARQPKSPIRSTFGTKFELPPRPDMMYREQSAEDYSDLFAEDDSVFNRRFGNMAVKAETPQLFHPSDLTKVPRSTQSPVQGGKRGSSKPRSAKRSMQRADSNISIEQFAEDKDDEDFSDIFGPHDETRAEKDESDKGSEDGALMLLSKLSNNSWLGDEEDEDDPFASMDPGWDEMDLEANIARDKHARLSEKVEELVRSLTRSQGDDRLDEISEDLVCLPVYLV